MSASLFYDCYAPYEYVSYPETEYVEGDKGFRALKKGDVIYCLKDGEMRKLIVSNPWHVYKRHFIITCEGRKTIDFGPENCANVSYDAPQNSICYHNMGILGTNKDSVIAKKIECINKGIAEKMRKKAELDEEIGELKEEMENLENLSKYVM